MLCHNRDRKKVATERNPPRGSKDTMLDRCLPQMREGGQVSKMEVARVAGVESETSETSETSYEDRMQKQCPECPSCLKIINVTFNGSLKSPDDCPKCKERDW